jgi:transcriptional regulator with XRE-family HTH domain
MSENKYAEFGRHLRNTRKMKYDDIKDFCNKTGIPPKIMYNYESGRTFPPIEKFIKICQCLDRSATYMLSPVLKLSDVGQEILILFEDTDLKDMLQDKEVSDLLKFTLLGFQILFHTKKHFNYDGDMVAYLNEIKEKLFTEGQLKRLN